MPKRTTAHKGKRPPKENRQRKSIASGRWRAGSHKAVDRKREADRIGGFDRDDLGESQDA